MLFLWAERTLDEIAIPEVAKRPREIWFFEIFEFALPVSRASSSSDQSYWRELENQEERGTPRRKQIQFVFAIRSRLNFSERRMRSRARF